MCSVKSFVSYLSIFSSVFLGQAKAELIDIDLARRGPDLNMPNRALVIPFIEGPSLMPQKYIDSFFRIKLLTFGENIYLYPKQNYRDLVGKNYGTAYLSCHYGDNWAWAVDDFEVYTWVQGKWGKFYEKPDEFVFAVTINNIDLGKMRRDCKHSLESYGVKIANVNQISFGVNHSYTMGTRLTQYGIVYYSEPDQNGISHLIVNNY